jgi:hypothetical protein
MPGSSLYRYVLILFVRTVTDIDTTYGDFLATRGGIGGTEVRGIFGKIGIIMPIIYYI